MVDVISGSSEDSTREAAVQVCYTMMSSTTLAPVITHSPAHCLSLTKSLIRWLLEGHKSHEEVTLTKMMLAEVGIHLRSQSDRNLAMASVIDNLLIPSARLVVYFEEDQRKVVQQLLMDMKELITRNLFHKELLPVYSNSLATVFSEETKEDLSSNLEKLLLTIISAFEKEPLEVTQYLLREFFQSFSYRFKNQEGLYFQMFLLFCHILNVSLPKTKVSSVLQNSLAAQKLKPLGLQKEKQEALLYSVLLAIDSASLDLTKSLQGITLGVWLENLGRHLVKDSPVSPYGYKCFHLLLAAVPQAISPIILKNIWCIYCYSDNTTMSQDALYLSYDELLCKVLEVYIKRQNVPDLLGKLLSGWKHNSYKLENQMIIPDSLIIYEGKMVIPPQ